MNKSIDGFKLKMIAIIAMLLNHIGSGFRLYEQSHVLYFFTELSRIWNRDCFDAGNVNKAEENWVY